MIKQVVRQQPLPISRLRRRFGTATAGALSGVIDPGLVLAGLGLLLALVCAAQFVNPVLLTIEDKAWLDVRAPGS